MKATYTPKHTPGPWTAVGSATVETAGDAGGRFPESRFRFMLTRLGAGAPPAEWQANAHLIAAAPDMLATLRMVRDSLRGISGCEQLRQGYEIGWLNDAIAKAEGRS